MSNSIASLSSYIPTSASSPAQTFGFIRLFDDGIRTVFQFLNYHEVPRLGQVSHHFQRLEKLYASSACSLDLSTSWSCTPAIILEGAIKKYANITRLDLSSARRLTPEECTRALTHWKCITDLNLSDCLDLGKNPIPQGYFNGKTGIRLTLPSTAEFGPLGYAELIRGINFSSLRSLDISALEAPLPPEVVARLVGGLSSAEQLEEFKFPITPNFSENIQSCLERLPQTIQRLNLRGVYLTSQLIDILVPKINAMALRLISLEFNHTNWAGSKKSEELLAAIPIERLNHMELHNLSPDPEAIRYLSSRLPHAKEMEVIYLTTVGSSNEDIGDFIQAVHPGRLRSLVVINAADTGKAELMVTAANKIHASPYLLNVNISSVAFTSRIGRNAFLVEHGLRVPPSVQEVARYNQIGRLHISLSGILAKTRNPIKYKYQAIELSNSKEEFYSTKSMIEEQMDEYCEFHSTTPIMIAKIFESIQTCFSQLGSIEFRDQA